MDTQRLAVRLRNVLITAVVVLFGTVSVAFASLTLSGTGITGDASFVSFTGATSTIFDVGSGKTLSLQTTNNGPITTGSGLFTIGGRVSQIDLGSSTFFGVEAGNSDDLTANMNAAFGYQALYSNTSGSGSNAFGYRALASSTGSNNSAFGKQALTNNVGGLSNSAFGSIALNSNTTGNFNAAFGSSASRYNTTGGNNSAFGESALTKNITGSQNMAIGFAASGYNTNATNTVAIGAYAGSGFPSDFYAGEYTAVGTYALASITTGAEDNTALGYQSGYTVSSGANNILIGYQAADALTTGSNNIVIGYNINLPAANSANMLNIGNLIYGTGVNGSETTVSTGYIGIGTSGPSSTLHVYRTSSSTMMIGATSSIACLAMGDSDGAGITYVSVNNGTISATTTKPTYCQ